MHRLPSLDHRHRRSAGTWCSASGDSWAPCVGIRTSGSGRAQGPSDSLKALSCMLGTGQCFGLRVILICWLPGGFTSAQQAAKRDRKAKFAALMHHVTVDRLRLAYSELKRHAAPGVDGVTWTQYQANLEENLQELQGRLQKGSYQAQPSRAGLHSQGRWQTKAAGHCIAGRQDRPASDSPGAKRHL